MIENMVVNLELSKELKRLGMPQKSEFWWSNFHYIEHAGLIKNEHFMIGYGQDADYLEDEHIGLGYEQYSAYLSDELLRWLPAFTNIMFNEQEYCIQADYAEYHKEYDKSLPNTLAKLLIYLITNGLLKVEGLR